MENLRKLIPNPGALFTFEAAARHLSFTRAGEELGISQAAVSYAIRQLEGALDVALFVRRHRRIALTDAGERFHNDVALGLSHIRRSAMTLREQRASHHVTVSASTAFAGHWMLPRLFRFRAVHPAIDLRLQTTDRDTDLGAERIDLGVRWGDGDWAEYDAALFAEEVIWPVCSPSFLDEAEPLETLDDLAGHKLIHLEEPFRVTPGWRHWFKAMGHGFGETGEGLRLNDYALVIQAAIEGQGIAMGWRHLTEILIGQGLLVRPLEAAWRTDVGFYLVWPKDRALSDNARTVRDWMLEAAMPMPARRQRGAGDKTAGG